MRAPSAGCPQQLHHPVWDTHNGCADVVRLFLADPRVRLAPSTIGNWAIIWASCRGHAEVVRLLLADSRVRLALGANDNEAIQEASQNGHTEVVDLLRAHVKK